MEILHRGGRGREFWSHGLNLRLHCSSVSWSLLVTLKVHRFGAFVEDVKLHQGSLLFDLLQHDNIRAWFDLVLQPKLGTTRTDTALRQLVVCVLRWVTLTTDEGDGGVILVRFRLTKHGHDGSSNSFFYFSFLFYFCLFVLS